MNEEIQERWTYEKQEDLKIRWSLPCQVNDTLCVTQSLKNAE